jgi:hypothetical protein
MFSPWKGGQPGPTKKEKREPLMYDTTYTTDFSMKSMVLCKDRTIEKTPGKWAKRRKQDRPATRVIARKEEICDKKIFKSMEKAKWAIELSNRRRARAAEFGHHTRRREVRIYQCFHHATRVFHLTSQDVATYNEKFDANRREEYCRAA